MTDAEVIVRILEAKIRLDMTRLFDPTGKWYSKSTHIHHIPKCVVSRAARFVRFVKRLRCEGAKNKQPKTAPVDSSAQLVVCKMASAFLYSICLMFKIDIKSNIKSWKKIMSLLTPFDPASGTVNLDTYVMKFSAKQSDLYKLSKMPSDAPASHVQFKSKHSIGANVDSKPCLTENVVGRELSTNHLLFDSNCNSAGESKPSASFTDTNNDFISPKIHSASDQSFATYRDWLVDKNDNDMNAANALITLALPSQTVENNWNQEQNIQSSTFTNGVTSISEVGSRAVKDVHLHSSIKGLERPHHSSRLIPALDSEGAKCSNVLSRIDRQHIVTASNSVAPMSKHEYSNLVSGVSKLESSFKATEIGSRDVMESSDQTGFSRKDSNVPVEQNDYNALSLMNSINNCHETGEGARCNEVFTRFSSKSVMRQNVFKRVDDEEMPVINHGDTGSSANLLDNAFSTSDELNSVAPVFSHTSEYNSVNDATDKATTLKTHAVSPPGPEKSDSFNAIMKSKIDLLWFSHPFTKVHPLRGWDGTSSANSFDEERWFDPRTCCLCNIPGDDDAGIDVVDSHKSDKYKEIMGSGRLLPLPSGGWVHSACATWSSEVWETPSGGILRGVGKARGRGGKLRCFGCGQYGATLGCHRSACNANFHFPCAKACGATFTSSHKLYCASHKQFAKDEVVEYFSESMKTLRVGDDDSNVDSHLCLRSGSLVIHSLGTIDDDRDGFHSKRYITPLGFTSSRIFWSFTKPKTRTVYLMRIVQSKENVASFVATASDAPTVNFRSDDVNALYNDIIDRVLDVNKDFFSHGDLLSVFPMVRSKKNRHGFCLNGPQVS
jgi:hypothetical protein